MRIDEEIRREPIKCGDETHHVWIDERGDMHLEDHNLEMLQAFTAFGAKKPKCLDTWERWEKYRSSSVDVALGATAFFHALPAHQLPATEQRWRKALRAAARRRNTIPSVEARYRGYTLRRFPTTDPEALFLGQATRSDRWVEGLRRREMWHSIESANGTTYVIENSKGEIVAETWTWRHGDVVLFEGVTGPFDAPRSKKDRDIVFRLLRRGGNKMLAADPTLNEVRIGKIIGRDVMQLLQGVALIPADAPIGHDIVPPPFDAIVTYDISGLLSAQEQYILARRGKGSTYFQSAKFKNQLAAAVVRTLKDAPVHGWRDSSILSNLGYYARMSPIPVAVVVTKSAVLDGPASRHINEVHELRIGDRTIAKWTPCSIGHYSDVFGYDWEWLKGEGHREPSLNVQEFLAEAVPDYEIDFLPEEPDDKTLPYMIDTGLYSVWVYDRHMTYVGSFEEEGDALEAAEFVADVLKHGDSPRARAEVYRLADWIDPDTESWYPGDIANWEQIA